jgi:hypothetical protein
MKITLQVRPGIHLCCHAFTVNASEFSGNG